MAHPPDANKYEHQAVPPSRKRGRLEDDCRRWTSGRARLPAALWDGFETDFYLRLDLAGRRQLDGCSLGDALPTARRRCR
jgi:hypothetical protein